MIIGYLNYPESKRNVHRADCKHPYKHNKIHRRIQVNVTTISQTIQKFDDKGLIFRSESGFNDLTVELDFGNEEFEIAVFKFLSECLAKHYRPFGKNQVVICSSCF